MNVELLVRQKRLMADAVRVAGVSDERVLAAMAAVPRHRFVPWDRRWRAYEDRPIPIGSGQTVSQPSLVARMLELLELSGVEKVLEIGTGSGYQAALLGTLAGEVWTIERMPRLANRARDTLTKLGYLNVTVIEGDGTEGYLMAAPYDAIIGAAVTNQRVAVRLERQLKDGGRLVLPVTEGGVQRLWKIVKRGGQFDTWKLMAVRFVPMVEE